MLWLGEILWDSGEVDGAQSPTSLQIFRAKGATTNKLSNLL